MDFGRPTIGRPIILVAQLLDSQKNSQQYLFSRFNRYWVDHIRVAVGIEVRVEIPGVSFGGIYDRSNFAVHANAKVSEPGSRIW